MASSISLILKHMETGQQINICNDIVDHLKKNKDYENHTPYVDTFCELMGQSDAATSKYLDFACTYSTELLQQSNPERSFDLILKLSLKIEKLSEKLMAYIVTNLKEYVAGNPRHFNERMVNAYKQEFIEVRNDELSNAFVLSLFKFTEWFFIHNETFSSEFMNFHLDKLCFVYLTNEELELAKSSSKVLKWRMASICQSAETTKFLWDTIFMLQESADNTEISYGFTLWLRFFGHYTYDTLKADKEFQEIISTEKYWYFLRDGLISLTHEHKKFALTLLQKSVQSLATDLSYPIIRWECAKEDDYIDSWKRFCTLYEILGIDAAMNQAQAATNDLLKIFSPASDIPVPFSLTILSVGFKASMDRIKSFALNLTFNLPKQSLSLFKNDFKFISKIFLPFTMKSSHFSVKKSVTGKYVCEFGDKIRDFICNCVDSLDNSEDISRLVRSIFEVIGENNLTFGIARIYITWGVLQGLERKNFKPLNASVLESLLALFATDAEGDICKTTLQTIHLKMLLQLDTSLDMAIVSSIAHFIQLNGYSIYADNEEFFLDHFNTYFEKEKIVHHLSNQIKPVSIEEFLVISSWLVSNKIDIATLTPYVVAHPRSSELLVQMATCGLQLQPFWKDHIIVSRVERLVYEMVDGSKDLSIKVYCDCAKLFSNEILFSNDFWASMRLDPLYENVSRCLVEVDNMEEAHYYIAQFKFITLCFPQCIFNEDFAITFESLTHLLKTCLKNIPKGSDSRFYKAKDELNSYILDNIRYLFKITPFTAEFKANILTLVDDVVSMSEYHTHLSNVKLIDTLLESCSEKEKFTSDDATSVASSLRMIWDDLIRDRLILSQRNLHQEFIRLLLHKKLLRKSIDDEQLGDSLFNILDSVVTNSTSRKGLMTCLTKAISEYQVDSPEDFEKTLWLSKLIVKSAFLFQSELNIFQLDCIISEEFDHSLNISGKSLYERVYGDPEVSYHVTIFAIVGSLKTNGFCSSIWSYIFNNDSMFNFLKPKKRTDREEQWKRIQFLSIFLCTAEMLDASELVEFLKAYLLPRLFLEASPICRTYIEWLICLAILRVPNFKDYVFAAFKEGVDAQKPLVVVTFERISMLISMQLSAEEESEFLTSFVTDIVLPLSSSNRSLNRHFSSSMACVIFEEINKKNLEFSPVLKKTLKNIEQLARAAGDFGSYRSGDALLWDVKKDLNLVSITGGLLLKITDREIDAIFETDYNSFLNEKQKSILTVPMGRDEKDLWISGKRSDEVKLESYYVGADEKNEESSLLQTKSGAWSTVMELDDNARAAAQVKRSPLIVVSSLVDKPPNLGGICRLCDCLGAGWMTVDDLSVKDDMEFKNVAVTADRWMPLIEVKIDQIIEFMRLKKKGGYTLIGLEQTDKSVELNNDLKFPEKSLILIGKEREGIPGDLLAELDMCVIIKQVGIVRSMNIQTATAVIVHAYSTQHC